ncbi:MAG: site-specific DNA-methyltransferase [Gammaproteobacteria bacterium]|nr:site-specific DNA-methyltransferase [Gammaproteobacteria bacterium]
MNGKSLNITEEKLARLREVLPEAFAEGAIDWEKLRVMLTRDGGFKDERYHLNWAGKTEAYRALQAATTATLGPCREESVGFDGAGHVFIEGENLAVLKVLQKACFGKVKMIYIDPPYNTGNDHFIYPDRFAMSKKDYQKRVGDMDGDGRLTREGLFRKNSRDNGHYHSNWLSMIYPRLFLARNLLRDDGVIFVSIDDNEAHNLRLVMNEIFGEENFVACFSWRRTDNQPNIGNVARIKEYVLCFSRNESSLKFNKMQLTERAKKEYRYSDDRGLFRRAILLDKTRGRHVYSVTTPSGMTLDGPWMIKEDEFNKLLKSNGIYWTSGKQEQPYGKTYLEDSAGQITSDFLGIEFGSNQQGSIEVEKLFGARYFDFPKPSSLIKHFVVLGSDNDGIVLDFFAGSCTTAHAVLELNKEDGGKRKFICVQMPEACDEKSEARKAGFKTIADIGKERIRRVLKNGGMNAGLKVFKLRESNFKPWRGDVQDAAELAAQMQLHTDPVVDGARTEDILYELLLKSGVSLTAPLRDHGGWYLAEDAGAKIAVALQRIDAATLKDILAAGPDKVITLDRLFQGNDQLKTNTALQMNDAGVGFEVV